MRTLFRRTGVLVIVGATVLAAHAAQAIDVTGTWVGAQICEYFDGSPRIVKLRDDTLFITQTGNTAFFASALIGVYKAQVIEDGRRPADKAEAVFVACSTTDESTFQELGRADKLQVTGSESIFQATSSFFQMNEDGYRFGGTCEWNYRRVDTADPGVTGCGVSEKAAKANRGRRLRP
jgi:hypothetical protein